ncbi:MAG: polyprenyl synthetase family protein [Candidatus Sericytochromatia bacterium]
MQNKKYSLNEIYEKILTSSLEKLDIFCEDKYVKEAVSLALDKTLNKIKEGKLSPAIFPVLLEQDLNLNKTDLAINLSVICAYFHTSADLADDIEDDSKNNAVINKYGKAQAINIVNKLMFLFQKNINALDIEDKNKISLSNFFSKCGNTMSNGQFYDLAMSNRVSFPFGEKQMEINDIISISKRKSGIELGCFTACLLVSLGKNHELYYNLGSLYGTMAQVFSDYVDIWSGIKSDDILELKNSLPIFASYHDDVLSKKMRVLLAGKNDIPSKQFIIRRFLSKTRAVEELKIYYEDSKSSIEELFKLLPNLNNFSELTNDLLSNYSELLETLLELRAVIDSDYFSDHHDLDSSINIGFEYLTSDKTFKDTWEIQRWGFLEEPILIGNLFTPALVLETLLEFDFDIKSYIEDFMKLKGEYGWCYYSNTQKLPTDSDLLGQLLNVTVRSGEMNKYEILFNEPLKILQKNIEPSGKCPTWLSDDINHTKDKIENTWFGNECLGVMANLYYGLYLFDKNKYEKIIKNGVDYIEKSFPLDKNLYSKDSYYNYYYMFYSVSRLINALNFNIPSLNKIKDNLLKEQLLNGSWNNSSQDTALVLLGLLSFNDTEKIVMKTASKYLTETQKYDGSWEGEDLFVCPGKDGRTDFYKNAKVTSAFCLRALNYSKKFLNK